MQVINAARVLASRPRSKVAQDNMDVFRAAWENQVRHNTNYFNTANGATSCYSMLWVYMPLENTSLC